MESGRQKIVLIAGASAAIAVALVLYFFAPSEFGFYPRCMLYSWTGLACPGCGSLRALHSLLHGEVATAFRLNPLLLILMPVLGTCIIARRKLSLSDLSPFWVWLLLGVMLLFAVVRNLPFLPFAWLKP
ncbi:MAG: DUF2752 domain-containing protein [Verrucomicrobia subdivision 3 bacterium]|nr:DUF2752 domain-containing protein [Limisphaerales bacterium]